MNAVDQELATLALDAGAGRVLALRREVERLLQSYGAALQDADASGRNVGSAEMVQSWRMGRCAMPVGAVEVLLDHAGDAHAGRVLDVLARRYGHVAVRLPEVSSATSGVRRAVIVAGAAVGELQAAYLDATSPESDGGEHLTPAEREDLASRVGVLVRQLVELEASLARPVRAVAR